MADAQELYEDPTVAKQDAFTGYESSEEDFPAGITRNTVGDVPMSWYDDFDHVGYDITGSKILKSVRQDEIDAFLAKADGASFWRTLWDDKNQREVILSDHQMEVLRRIQAGEYADDAAGENPLVTYDTKEDWIHPTSNVPEPKRRFQPSKWEAQRVSYLVTAIKRGWIKLDKEVKDPNARFKFTELWAADEITPEGADPTKRQLAHIPAPKMPLPGHNESYNPSAEYLFNEEEEQQWKEMDLDERPTNFIPQSYSALRLVPSYKNAVRERFHRCLDLYMCPRQVKMRMNVDPDSLLPDLPKPADLKPFPSRLCVRFMGHTGVVRAIDVDPTGQWLASGSDDGTVRIWEVDTARCVRVFKLEGCDDVTDVSWNPNPQVCLVGVSYEAGVLLINPAVYPEGVLEKTDSLFAEGASPKRWQIFKSGSSEWVEGRRLFISSRSTSQSIVWHKKGDYFATLSQKSKAQVWIHRLTQRRSQNPFRKTKDPIQKLVFHPSRPYIVVATQQKVRIFDLTSKSVKIKLKSGVKWISDVAFHPSGDHLIVSSYDSKVAWFDLDMSDKPFRVLRYHKEGATSCHMHRHLPLFASASHDGTVHVFHGRVFDDIMQNPLIVPVKVLRGHEIVKGHLGIFDIKFHPKQPWIFSAGADQTIRLWC